jgi:4-amino-4-deoxy-L-arabinose transferase-like glycosyltransferase
MKKILIVILIIASFLRLWKLSINPVSLFGDELDVGYQAYSILKTGKDYYGNPWPIHFHSLAEWRTPLYLYSAVPTVAIFGITPLGVRLPAAIFGILSILVFYLLVNQLTNNRSLALIAAGVLAFSPWHIQYSRAGFEVTLLLLLLLLGLWLFFKSISNGKWLWLSAVCFGFTPWVYSTAKLFTPLFLLFLFIVWRKEILKIPRKFLLLSFALLVIVATPITYSTFYGGGSQRFGYISIFTDPTTEPEVGSARQLDARVRGETGVGLTPTLIDKIIHNKYTFWGSGIIRNYFQAFSTNFLFIKGDLNLRHSIGIGEFYKIEIIPLILGIIFFFVSKRDCKIKLLMAFWILAGVIPAAITRDGGNHATRLILILPPLIFLVAYGIKQIFEFNKFAFLLLFGIWILGFGAYLHQYYVHYPWESERWWHAGFKEGIQSIKAIDKNYDKVVISTANEPPWIFFAGWYEYPPDKWQKNFPIGNDIDLSGFGKVSHIDKFYFGSPMGGVYDWGKVIDKKTLYLAVAKEVGPNLILEPSRTPSDLSLVKAIAYPSGEPAFYIFSGIEK